jgi:hypothetical protein
MKVVKYIAVTSAVIALTALEVSAQSSSSATQTVTFGVRRTQSVVLANLQSPSVAVTESAAEQAAPLKMTVGTSTRSRSIAYRLARKPAPSTKMNSNSISPNAQTFASLQRFNDVGSAGTVEPATSDRFVVTLTE